MKTAIFLMSAAALAVAAGAAPLCTTSPGTWCEAAIGDAGSFPGNSQATMGTGTVNGIIGNIGNGTAGSDVYSILITNTAQFSASLAAYTATGATGEDSAALYLFNAQGKGIEAALEGTALAGFNGTPGIYYVDVAPDGNNPEYTVTGNHFDMFTNFVNGQDSLPVAGAGSINVYTHNGCGVGCEGAYEVTLTGAQYSNLPEPGSLGLMGGAFAALSLFRRFRRQPAGA